MLEKVVTQWKSVPYRNLGSSSRTAPPTERERLAGALRASEARYRALYENIPLMHFTLDSMGTVLSVNEHGAREMGYKSDEVVGQSVFRVIHPEDQPAAEWRVRRALESPGKVSRWELRKVCKDSTVLWVCATLCVLPNADSTPEILLICQDVTEYRRVVQRLNESWDRLRHLNANLSRVEEREERRLARMLHDELGQTLMAVRMAICGLRDAEPVDDPLRRKELRLEELQRMVDTSIEITRSLTFQLNPPILYELGLTAALQALGERMAQDHNIAFCLEVGEEWSPPPPGDLGFVLYRMVRELFHNIAKHARADSVRLRLGGTRGEIQLTVEDDGVGFDSAGACRVGAEWDGCSVGLFHIQERMDWLGGLFEIDSTPGRGTRVVLSLPTAVWGEPSQLRGRRSQ